VLRKWFKANATFGEHADILLALGQVRSVKDAEDGDEAYRASWRSILNAFVHDDCPAEVRAFLDGRDDGGTPPELPGEPSQAVQLDVTEEDAGLCLDIASGKPYLGSARLIPTVVSGIVSALMGDIGQATMRKDGLANSPSPVARKFGDVISRLEGRQNPASKEGLSIRKSITLALAKIEDPHACAFFGIVKRVLPSGQTFIRLAGLMDGDDLVELTPEQAREHFPSSGDATAYPAALPIPCREGGTGIWNAEHKNTDKATQYVATGQVSRVYDVVAVPHSSSEPDKVRQWLQGNKAREAAFPLFLLSDGLLLKFPGDLTDPSKFSFDNPLDGYWGHEAIQLSSGRLVVIKQLPAADIKYDCAPATTWIKRLVKHRSEADGFPAFSRAQLQALVDFAKEHVNEPTFQGYLRAKAKLQDTDSTRELLEGSIQDLLVLPEVSARIETEKEPILQAYKAQLANLEGEIAGLEKSKKALLDDHEKQKKAAREEMERVKKAMRLQEVELERRIKDTFAKATEDGIGTLAQVALVRAIVPGTNVPGPAVNAQGPSKAIDPPPGNLPPRLCKEDGTELESVRDVLKAIRRRAASGGLSESMLASVVAAGRVSPVIGLLGGRARNVASAVADLVANGVICEVSVTGDMFGITDLMKSAAMVRADGQTWSTSLGEFLEYQQAAGSPSVVELRGINRSPPESFLPELLDLRMDVSPPAAICWTDKSGTFRHAQITMPTVFVVTFVAGKSTFPLQGPLAHAVPLVQVDRGWADEEAPDPSLAKEATRISVGTWLSLGQDRQGDRGVDGNKSAFATPEARLSQAAMALGIAESEADAVAFMSLKVGRLPATEILDRIERDSPGFIAYAKEATGGDTARMLDHVIQPELGEQLE
jgi:hypothetical protein